MQQPLTINIERERSPNKLNKLLPILSWQTTLWEDFQIIFDRDPAANNWLIV